MRRVYYVTGSRADFGLMLPTLEAISKFMDVGIIVTGSHFSEKKGYTFDDISKTGLKIVANMRCLHDEISTTTLAFELAHLMTSLCAFFKENRPDILIIEGDRWEVLGAALAAVSYNIPLAHVSGGDVTKSLDDSIRHSVTKLSHIHFPGTPLSKQRILQLGEEPWRVHMVGTPLPKIKLYSRDELSKVLQVDLSKQTLVVLQHPVTTQSTQASTQMIETLEAVVCSRYQTIVLAPNTDPGSEEMSAAITRYISKYPGLFYFKHLHPDQFASLLYYATCLIGNSSAGIVEAPSYNLWAINVGIRQQGRERGTNVIDCDHDKEKILAAITSLPLKKIHDSPYLSDGVAEKIALTLRNVVIDDKLMNKSFVDFPYHGR